MTVLKIDTSARLEGSNSRQITDYLVERLGQEVVSRDLAATPPPSISAEDLLAVHGSASDQRDSLSAHLALSEQYITEVKSADTLVFGVSMYNFTVPAVLKQWIDYVLRVGHTFQYGANGPQGLSGVKRAFIVTATGGTPVGGEMDFASGYLELILKVIGVEHVFHIDASGSKGEPEKIIAAAKQQIDQLLD